MRKETLQNESYQRRIGIILSYVLLGLNMCVGILITPVIVGTLGDRENGLYQTIASFANSLAILDFGIGTTITRFLSKYKGLGDQDNQTRVIFAVGRLTTILSGITLALGCIFSFFTPVIYQNTQSPQEIKRAQIVFLIIVVNVAITLFDHYFVGICSSEEKFQFININRIVRILLRVFLILVVLRQYPNAITLSLVDLAITIIFLIVDMAYVFIRLKIKIIRIDIPKLFFKEIVLFGTTLLLQSFVNQVNTHVDKVLLGALSTLEIVTIYSVAMQIFGIFNALSTAINSVYLPHVTKKIHSGATNEEIDDIIIQLGRKQFMITGLCLVGFVIVGRDFIRLWMGEQYMGAWTIALIIMVPSMIELIESIAISVTLAKGKNGIRTLILAVAALFNIIFTIIFIKWFGYLGAPIATALSYVFGYIVATNIFYYKVLGINVIRVFKGIFNRIWLCLLGTGLCSIPLFLFMSSNFLMLFIKVVYVAIFFAFFMFVYGFDKEEKNSVKKLFSKVFRKKQV